MRSPEAGPNFRRRITRAVVGVAAAALALGACSSAEPTTAIPEGTVAAVTPDTMPPATATTVCIKTDYDKAQEAMRKAHDEDDFSGASVLLEGVQDPAMHAQANTVLQLARAENAAWTTRENPAAAEALVDTIQDVGARQKAEDAVDLREAAQAVWQARKSDVPQANVLLNTVEAPAIYKAAVDGVSLARRAEMLWKQEPRDTSAWATANDQSTSAWASLNDRAIGAWADLDSQTSDAMTSIQQQTPDHC